MGKLIIHAHDVTLKRINSTKMRKHHQSTVQFHFNATNHTESSSPPVGDPSCPGLAVGTPHRCPPYSSGRPSSGTFSDADTKPANGNKTIAITTKTHCLISSLFRLVITFDNKPSCCRPLGDSGSRTAWWTSVAFYTCDRSRALSHPAPPDQ